jgi:hypothetical protein
MVGTHLYVLEKISNRERKLQSERNRENKKQLISFVYGFNLLGNMPIVNVTVFDILKYINGRHRPLKEGEAVLKAGHIILCGIKGDSCCINSLYLQTSALSSVSHEIEITLAENVVNWRCLCTCKAGQSGFCKHIAVY